MGGVESIGFGENWKNKYKFHTCCVCDIGISVDYSVKCGDGPNDLHCGYNISHSDVTVKTTHAFKVSAGGRIKVGGKKVKGEIGAGGGYKYENETTIEKGKPMIKDARGSMTGWKHVCIKCLYEGKFGEKSQTILN